MEIIKLKKKRGLPKVVVPQGAGLNVLPKETKYLVLKYDDDKIVERGLYTNILDIATKYNLKQRAIYRNFEKGNKKLLFNKYGIEIFSILI